LSCLQFDFTLILQREKNEMKTLTETDQGYICDIQAPCFQSLLPGEAELIKISKTQVMFRKDDNLTKQGAFTSYVLYIITGWAKQYLEGSGNRSFNLRIIRPGDFVGLSAVFDRNSFDSSCVALTDCHAILIDKNTMTRLMKENGAFGFSIAKRYSVQNNDLLSVMDKLLYKQMNGRLAGTLLYLDAFRSGSFSIFRFLSRKDVAEFSGLSTESTIKLLKNFEKGNLLRLDEKDIQLLNLHALEEISRKG
jgi:CRP/FNR family transcriptional regulator